MKFLIREIVFCISNLILYIDKGLKGYQILFKKRALYMDNDLDYRILFDQRKDNE